jgi:diaminopimelate decarboxylase
VLAPRFDYRANALHCEEVALADVAGRAATPCYVYSSAAILDKYRAYDEAFGDHPHRVCYSVKANGNLAILALLARAGASFDIVSGGELHRVLRAGAPASGVVFSGVGKTAHEVEAAMEAGIHGFHCESEAELALIDALASRLGRRARVAVRVNPDIDATTHPYISTGLRDHKFGIDIAEVEGVYERAAKLPHLDVAGVSCHIGSQMLDTDPIAEALAKMLALVDRLRARGHAIRYLDLGGGLGVAYKPEDSAPAIREAVGRIAAEMRGRDLEVMVEPGRSIAGEAGVLLTRVLYRKRSGSKEFIVVDAAMNDLIRPSLYRSHHEIVPLRLVPERGAIVADVVGPVCETGDFLARDREIANVFPGDLLAVCTAGAYGFVLSSNYNGRPRPPEVLVEGSSWRLVRDRETLTDLVRGERL